MEGRGEKIFKIVKETQKETEIRIVIFIIQFLFQ